MNDELLESLEKDLGISSFAAELSHILPCLWDIDYSLENVEKVVSYYIYDIFSS